MFDKNIVNKKNAFAKAAATPRQKAWITRLRPELHRFFPSEAGHLDIRVAGPPDLHTYSRLYPFTVLADGLPLTNILIKVPHGRKATDVPRAYQAARLLEQRFADDPHLHVPRTLGMWEDPPALIMEKVTGEPLFVRMKDCRNWAIETGCQLTQHFIERAGQWLALLHESPVPSWSQPAPDPVEKMAGLLERLRPFGIDPLEEKRIREQVRILETLPSPDPVPLHGDFTLRNILCQPPQSIAVLDTELALRGDAALDIGWFIAAVRFIDKWQVFAGEMAYTAAVVRQTEEKFLHGYESIRPLPSPEALRAYTVLRLLERWLEFVDREQTRNIAGLRSLVIRRVNQHFVRAILGR